MRPRISIRGLVRPLVHPLVRRSVTLSSKSMKNGLLRIQSDSHSAGRGRERNKEEVGTRRKEGQGGNNEESEKKENVVKKMKNEKVAKGRTIGLAGPCSPEANKLTFEHIKGGSYF